MEQLNAGMNNMKSATDVVLALQDNNSLLRKREIVQAAWDQGILEFFQGAQLCYNSFKTFGIKQVPTQLQDNMQGTLGWQDFAALAEQLATRKLTGNAARTAVANAMNECSAHMWNGFYRRILLKDLKCKLTETVLNQELDTIATRDARASAYVVPVFSCQLAKDANEHAKKLTGEKFLDIKLDGVRLLTVLDIEQGTVTQYTRNGLVNNKFTNITDRLQLLLPHLAASMVLDGEVMSENFQKLMTQLNRKTAVDTADSQLHLFDIVPLVDFQASYCATSQRQRHAQLLALEPLLAQHCGTCVQVVPKTLVDLDTAQGQQQFREFNNQAVLAGFEGIMIKHPEAVYECKRRDHWLKIKPSITVDLEVVAVEPGKSESKHANTLGNLVCRGVDQDRMIEVSVGSGFSDELRDEIWQNQHGVLGMIVEIKADAVTRSQDGDTYSLRFPTFVRFRGNSAGEKI